MENYDYYYLAKKNLLPGAEERHRVSGTIRPGMRVHVGAVCGKAMASIACLLQEYGCIVTGSDDHFAPPMSDVLDAHGIKRLEPSAHNVENIDLLVAGNALSYNSVEPAEAREKNIPTISGAEAVAQIFAQKRSLVVAGTHGKTTTSALLTHVFKESGRSPAYMIGGVFQGTSDDSYNIGGQDSKFAIYEGDEYNCAYFDQAPKFLRYNPTSAIITSIEQDHVDLYPTFPDYLAAFQFLVEDLPRDGYLIIHESAAALLELAPVKAHVHVYGSSPQASIQYRVEQTDAKGSLFSLTMNGEAITDLRIPLFGAYNVENAVSVSALALLEGITPEELRKSLATFPGTKERQELLGMSKSGVTVIRDYAHHPTAVALTLEGIRLHYPHNRIVSIFEPKSASSRRKVFEERYAEALEHADVSIVISPVLKPTEDRSSAFDPERVKHLVEVRGKTSHATHDLKEALELLSKTASSGDVAVFMSPGDMEDIDHLFLQL